MTDPRLEVPAVIATGFNAFAAKIHEANYIWWHDSAGKKLDRNLGEMIALMHSELSEMLEGVRKSKMDDHLPHRTSEEVEAADLLIRMFDYIGVRGLDIDGAITEKLAYNRTRADHSYADRAKQDGKKF